MLVEHQDNQKLKKYYRLLFHSNPVVTNRLSNKF